jgi:DMSO/TMAO reductase YedYZ molybdopterin-dependent catalytic subunit
VIQRTRPVRTPRRPPIPEDLAERVPPGQIVATRWPVLHQGDLPPRDLETWDFRIWGEVGNPLTWNWDEFASLPVVTICGDLHCVTRWSSLDHRWSGVRPRTLVDVVRPTTDARFVLLHGEGGYSANLPLDALLDDDVVLATGHDGEPLTVDHGGPLRAVVPGRYAWKSVKWLRGIEFLRDDQPGFWEGYGYSDSADPWQEERFQSPVRGGDRSIGSVLR